MHSTHRYKKEKTAQGKAGLSGLNVSCLRGAQEKRRLCNAQPESRAESAGSG